MGRHGHSNAPPYSTSSTTPHHRLKSRIQCSVMNRMESPVDMQDNNSEARCGRDTQAGQSSIALPPGWHDYSESFFPCVAAIGHPERGRVSSQVELMPRADRRMLGSKATVKVGTRKFESQGAQLASSNGDLLLSLDRNGKPRSQRERTEGAHSCNAMKA